MNSTRQKKKYLRVGIVFAVFALMCIAAFIGMNRVSLDKLQDYISSGEYETVVEAYNKYAVGDEIKEKECGEIINDAITEVVLSWSAGNMSAEDASNCLDIFCGLNNKELSDTAFTNKYFIIFENESNERYEQAESLFKSEQYFEALQTLDEIDPSYTQYDFVKEFIGECEEIIVAQVSYPTTIEEYEEYQNTIDEYLDVHSCEAFVQQKQKMKDEHDTFASADPFMKKARVEFDNGNYRTAFDVLEKAREENPSNHFINETLDELHNIFVIGKAQEISEKVKKGEKSEALKMAKDAIEIYDWEDLRAVKKYVLEEKDPLYGVVSSITAAFSEWKEEKYDVKQARNNAGAYIVRSGKKMFLGDYDEDSVTLLSASGEVATSLLGIDMALDARDLSYDITHWGEGDYFTLRLATDAVALVPVVGAVKYLKYSKEAGKGIKKTAKKAKDVLGETTDAARTTNRIVDSSTDLANNADESAAIAKVGFRHYTKVKTINQDLAGKVHPITGVPFETKKLKYSDGRKIEAVFPVFESTANIKLPRKLWKASFNDQKKWLMKKLKKQVKRGMLDDKLTKEEREAILKGIIPEGYTWHHSEKEGLVQLVDSAKHDKTAHTGGMSLWGEGYKTGVGNGVD